MIAISTFAGIADNFIRPYLSGFGVIKVPLLLNFLAIIGGVMTFGLPGLFIGPLVSILSYGLLPIIFKEWAKK